LFVKARVGNSDRSIQYLFQEFQRHLSVVEFIVAKNEVGVLLRLDFRHEWMDVITLSYFSVKKVWKCKDLEEQKFLTSVPVGRTSLRNKP
jgi:hypothetical protein